MPVKHSMFQNLKALKLLTSICNVFQLLFKQETKQTPHNVEQLMSGQNTFGDQNQSF